MTASRPKTACTVGLDGLTSSMVTVWAEQAAAKAKNSVNFMGTVYPIRDRLAGDVMLV